jgi:hypothetical protein
MTRKYSENHNNFSNEPMLPGNKEYFITVGNSNSIPSIRNRSIEIIEQYEVQDVCTLVLPDYLQSNSNFEIGIL